MSPRGRSATVLSHVDVDPVERALALLREEAERLLAMESLARKLDQPVVWSFLRLRQGHRKCVGGDLVEAERLATEAVERGRAAGYQDSEVFYAGQMWVICFHAGRLGDLRPVFELAAAARPGHTVLRAALAAIYAEIGQPALCQGIVEQLGPDDFVTMDQDLLVTAAVATIAACGVGDTRLAGIVRDVLAPHEGRLIDNAGAVAADYNQTPAFGVPQNVQRDHQTTKEIMGDLTVLDGRARHIGTTLTEMLVKL